MNMNERKGGISLHLSGLAVALVILAIARRIINRTYLTRAKKSLTR